jgi:hypothetical protein
MGWACRSDEKDGKQAYTHIFVTGNLLESGHLEDREGNGRVTLKLRQIVKGGGGCN